MQTIILAGGLGTRLAEETVVRPKPMVEIGGHPIIWHIMQIYAANGFNDFIVAAGYKAEFIKQYFCNFVEYSGDLVIDMKQQKIQARNTRTPDWTVSIVDTGQNTQTGGRIKRLANWIGDNRFMMTYGDGVGNIDVRKLVLFHQSHGKLATLTAVRPPARFGGLVIDGDRVSSFSEKPQVGEGWINGGFMVLEPGVFNYIENDDTLFERGPMERLAEDHQLMVYRHEGFWQPMDTLREKQMLESLWLSGNAPWKTW